MSVSFFPRVENVVAAFSCLLLGLSAGCAGKTESADDDTPTSDGFETMSVVTYPAYAPGPPPGSTCDPIDHIERWSLDGPSRTFSWDYCGSIRGETIYAERQDEREVTETELASALQALDQVRPSAARICHRDALPTYVTLDLTTRDGTKLFVNDDASNCPSELQDGRTFASHLGDLARTLSNFVRD